MKSFVCNPAINQDALNRHLFHIYTGDGKGKTTAALGTAIRALGHGMNVTVVQLLKGYDDCGEWKFYQTYIENSQQLKWKKFGRKEFVDPKNILPEDIQYVQEGLQYARAQAQHSHLLICDELNVALTYKLVELSDVMKFIDAVLPHAHLIITGRGMPNALKARADLVTVMNNVKHPYENDIPAVRGLDY